MSGASTSDSKVSLGFSGLYASVGDHIGHFYLTNAEWRDFLVPFLQTGLGEGDKCVYVMSPGSRRQEVRGALEQLGVKVDEALGTEQLEVIDGGGSVEEMQQALQRAIADAQERFRLLRFGGDMTWSLGSMPNSASLMEWERIRHVPVEDNQHRLVGLVSYRCLLRLLARGKLSREGRQIAVSEIMKKDPITVTPETTTLDAIDLMRQHGIGCLPVVKEGHLAGIITERDFMNVASELIEEKLRE